MAQHALISAGQHRRHRAAVTSAAIAVVSDGPHLSRVFGWPLTRLPASGWQHTRRGGAASVTG